MKKFYLHNGAEQLGPYSIEDLKTKNINRNTSIWYEGLLEWTTAGQIEELKELIGKVPPPFGANNATPPPVNRETTHYSPIEEPKKNRNSLVFFLRLIGGLGLLVIIAIVIFMAQDNAGGSSDSGETYQEKVMTVEEIERADPTKFLKASGTYSENFWGTKLKVNVVIENNATVASYKDAIVKIIYYSKTGSQISSFDYTFYDVFFPTSRKSFDIKIENYKNVNSIGWEVIKATPN